MLRNFIADFKFNWEEQGIIDKIFFYLMVLCFAALILGFSVCAFAADVAVKDMTEITPATSPAIAPTTDILYIVADPAGTPVDRKVVPATLTRINTVTDSGSGDYTVSTVQGRAGTFIINTYAGAKKVILPSAEAGMSVCVRNGYGVAQILRIDTDGSDYIVLPTGARTSGAGDQYGATASAANQVCVVAFNATDWYVTSTVGTWAEDY